MTTRSVTHATFTLERTFEASPARVFKAFANPESKAQWFSGPPGWKSERQAFDFRVGGREYVITADPGGTKHIFDCLYQDIVPNERLVYTYEMLMDDKRISVSVATFEFRAAGQGTHLVLTEMGAFLDGFDGATREEGTRGLMERIDAWVKSGQ